MTDLTQKKCRPCEGIGKPYGLRKAQEQAQEIPEWTITDDGKGITRQFVTKDFKAAVEFIRLIAEVAESEDHHPDIHLTGYRKLRVDLSTHAVGGLSENDFIVAAKINTLPVELKR